MTTEGIATLALTSASPAQTQALGGALGAALRAGDVILLVGELGSGKTTFVKGLVGSLDATIEVTSPTFVLCHVYETTPLIAHVDCWRMESPDEVVDLALEEVLDESGVVIIEWGELARPVVGDEALTMNFGVDPDNDDVRRIALTPSSAQWAARLAELAKRCGALGLIEDVTRGIAMIILAIESATIEVGVALVEDDLVRGAFSMRTARQHGTHLHPAIEELMASSGIEFSEIAAIGIDVGPGLFTGLRVGIASAMALGMALDVPLVPVRSTEALRLGAGEAAGSVIPVVDMRRGECGWEWSEGGELNLGPPEVLAQALSRSEGAHLLVGDGARRYAEVFLALAPGVSVADDDLAAPSPVSVGLIASRKFAAGEGRSALSIEPIYLRAADAKVNFATRDDVLSLSGTGHEATSMSRSEGPR